MQTPVDPKNIDYKNNSSFKHPLKVKKATLATTMILAYSRRKNRDVASKPTKLEHINNSVTNQFLHEKIISHEKIIFT